MQGKLIDADAFEADMKQKYCRCCDDMSGIKCKMCWVEDMFDEIREAPEAEVNAG